MLEAQSAFAEKSAAARQHVLHDTGLLYERDTKKTFSTPKADLAASALRPPVSSASQVAGQSATQETGKDAEEKKPQFDDFALAPALRSRLKAVGFNHAFPIQAASFPFSLAGRDVIARAFTGSS